MKVAFSNYTEKDYCGDLITPTGQRMTTVDLAEQCSQFCGSEAVPLLVGSIDFGFNQSAMDSVCINSNIVTTDSDKVTQCLRDAEAMAAVDTKMAAFLTALTQVELAKVEYETAVAAKLPGIKAKIEEKAEDVLKGARADQKAAVYSTFLREQVFNEVTGSSQQAVKYKEALNRMGTTVESLRTTVAASIKAYSHFLANCSQLYTGKGLYKEYLLDQCSQTSTECVDSDWGYHAGCCCGYTPFMAVGQEKVSFSNTIPGITAEALADNGGLSRVGNRLRRLSATPKSYYDICGSVWEDSSDILASFHSEISSLGSEAIFQDWMNAMETRYPDADVCLFQNPTKTTPSPSPSGSPSPSPSGSPSPSPSGSPSPSPSSPSPSPSPSGGGNNNTNNLVVSGAVGAAAHLPALALVVLAAAAPRAELM